MSMKSIRFFSISRTIWNRKRAATGLCAVARALGRSEKVGIAKVIIKNAPVSGGCRKRRTACSFIELMHFAEELADNGKLHVPKKLEPRKKEMDIGQGASR